MLRPFQEINRMDQELQESELVELTLFGFLFTLGSKGGCSDE